MDTDSLCEPLAKPDLWDCICQKIIVIETTGNHCDGLTMQMIFLLMQKQKFSPVLCSPGIESKIS